MKRILILLSAVLFIKTAIACLNEYHVSKSGKSSVDEFAMGDLYVIRNFNNEELEKKLDKLKRDTSANKDDILYNQNNIAVYLIKLGRLEEAKKVLETLLKKNPNEYNVVVNLGTLYELMGQNKKALEFIKKGMTLNPESHNGSEWFHVKVLEYKLKERNDSQILQDNILDMSNSKMDVSSLAYGVSYQLGERIPFTPAPNMMIAKILLEYGDFLAEKLTIEGAYVVYGIAEEYDMNKVLPLEERRKQLLPLFKKHKVKVPDYKNYFVTAKIAEQKKVANENTSKLLEEGIKTILSGVKNGDSAKSSKPSLWPYVTGGFFIVFFVFLLIRRKKKVDV